MAICCRSVDLYAGRWPGSTSWTEIYNTTTAISKPLPYRLSKRLFNYSYIVLSLCIKILSPWVTGILPSSTAPFPLSTPPQTTLCPNHSNILLLTSGLSPFLNFSAAPQIHSSLRLASNPKPLYLPLPLALGPSWLPPSPAQSHRTGKPRHLPA